MLLLDQRRNLVEAKVTLNDRPAKISGYTLSFAIVRNDNGQSAEWAWETVERIVEKGGKFYL